MSTPPLTFFLHSSFLHHQNCHHKIPLQYIFHFLSITNIVLPRIANKIIISSLSGSIAVIIAAIANKYANTTTESKLEHLHKEQAAELTKLCKDFDAQALTIQTLLDTIEKSKSNTQTTLNMPELVGKNVGPIGYGLMGLFIAIYSAIAY